MEEDLRDKVIRCKDCGRKVTFSVWEQKLFGQKGWPDPIRCIECRRLKKLTTKALEDGISITDQPAHVTTCFSCGRKLVSTRKVQKGEKEYCSECWNKVKFGSS